MWLTILAHEGEIGWDELALFIVAGLFVLVSAGAWLASRRFKPVLDEDAGETSDPGADEGESPPTQ